MNEPANSPSLIRVRYIPAGANPGGSWPVYTLTGHGRKYSESTAMLAREDRSADGKLRRDLTASKKTFTLAYDALDNEGLSVIEEIYNKYAGAELILEVTHGAVVETYNVLIKAFAKQRLLSVRGGLWEGVTVEFEEI
jgi:hypothetical protein